MLTVQYRAGALDRFMAIDYIGCGSKFSEHPINAHNLLSNMPIKEIKYQRTKILVRIFRTCNIPDFKEVHIFGKSEVQFCQAWIQSSYYSKAQNSFNMVTEPAH